MGRCWPPLRQLLLQCLKGPTGRDRRRQLLVSMHHVALEAPQVQGQFIPGRNVAQCHTAAPAPGHDGRVEAVGRRQSLRDLVHGGGLRNQLGRQTIDGKALHGLRDERHGAQLLRQRVLETSRVWGHLSSKGSRVIPGDRWPALDERFGARTSDRASLRQLDARSAIGEHLPRVEPLTLEGRGAAAPSPPGPPG